MTGRHDPVVFDMDGTLVDSAPAIVKAIHLACARLGVEIPTGADLTRCVGPPFEVALPQVLGPLDNLDALISEYRTIYKPLAEAETIPMAGARETLSRLREAGVTVAVATYKRIDLAMALLGATGLTPLLDVCRGRVSDEDRRDKTAILLQVLEEMSPHRGEPLYVGDHEEDRKAAEALGVDFLPYVGPESWDELARVVRVN